MSCNESMCLDKKEKTKIITGSSVSSLDEFDNLVNKDPKLKKKMKTIEEKLKKY